MDPIVNISIVESGMSIQTIEKEIAAQIRKHEAQLKHWRLVKAATAKLRGAPRTNGATVVRKSTEAARKHGKRTRKATPAARAMRAFADSGSHPRAVVHDRTTRRKPAPVKLGKLMAGAK